MNSGKKIKFALVGTGNIAGTYVKAASRVDEAEIVAAVSRNAERAAQFAKENSIAEGAGSLADIKGEFDAVMLATPNGLHHRDALEAFRLGKHVLTEKPLDVTVEKMQEMVKKAAEAGRLLGVTFQRRTVHDAQAVKKLLDRKAFGKVYAVDLAVKFFRPQSYYDSAEWRGTMEIDGGGPFIQQASHNVDTLVWMFGLPAKVFARTALVAHSGIEVEDHGVALLTYPDGMLCTVIASTAAAPGYPVRIELHTERGTVVLINDEITRWDIEGIPNPAQKMTETVHSGAGADGVKVADTSGHEAIIADFCRAIVEGRAPLVPGTDGLRTGILIDTIYRSAREGCEVGVE